MIATPISSDVVSIHEVGHVPGLPPVVSFSYSQDNETATDDLLGRYLREIDRYPLLTEQQERSLMTRIAHGDEHARAQLIESNLRLVVSIARHYQGPHNSGMGLLDLIGYGHVGLVRAVDKYDPTFGVRFATYATYRIKATILRALDDQSRTIRLSAYRVAQARHVLTLQDDLMHSLERVPTLSEIATHAGLSQRVVEHVVTAEQPPLSLEALLTDDEDSHRDILVDPQAPDPMQVVCDQEQACEMQQAVQIVLASLTLREREVITCKFGLDGNGERTTAAAIGQELGICQSRVYQLLTSAMSKMRCVTQAQGVSRDLLERFAC